MSMAELVSLYNRLTGKTVRRFSTRERGAELVLKAENGSKKHGRPFASYCVTLAPKGKITVREDSIRGKIIAHLKTLSSAQASIKDLEEKFGKQARGAVHKLIFAGWLTKEKT